jgi:hypothetical protein
MSSNTRLPYDLREKHHSDIFTASSPQPPLHCLSSGYLRIYFLAYITCNGEVEILTVEFAVDLGSGLWSVNDIFHLKIHHLSVKF